MSYPEYFPNNCPPSDAVNEEWEVFRLCKSEEISHSDFLSFYEMGKLKSSDDIKKYGISVFSDFEHAKATAKLPALKNMRCIAKGITKKDLGVVKRTPSNNSNKHITWWLKKNTQPENYFKSFYLRGDE